MWEEAERPDFYACTRRRASKLHLCTECSGPIPEGEVYHYSVAKHDGKIEQAKRCWRCQAEALGMDPVEAQAEAR